MSVAEAEGIPEEGEGMGDGPRSRTNSKGNPGTNPVKIAAKCSPNVDIGPMGERDTVTWGAVEYLADEGDGEIEIDVLRWGPALTKLLITYKIQNCNMHPDVFENKKMTIQTNEDSKISRPHENTVIMQPGQINMKVKIPIVDDPYWNVEGLMTVDLEVFKGKGDVGDLSRTTIVVLNDDDFPMNVDTNPETNPRAEFDTVLGFIKHNYHLAPRQFWWCVLYKLVPAMTWLVGVLLMKNTLDLLSECLSQSSVDDDDARDTAQAAYTGIWPLAETWGWINDDSKGDCVEGSVNIVWVFAVIYLINHGIAFTVDCSIGDLCLGGRAIRGLRTGIFSVMLQFTRDSDEKFPTGKVMKIMESQTESAVKLTWLNVFTLVEKVFSLLIVSLYIIVAGLNEGGNMLFVCLAPFVVIAGQALVFVHSKSFVVDMNTETMNLDDKWSERVAERAVLRPLITNYRWGYHEADAFEEIHKAYNEQWAETDGWWGVTLWRVATVAEIIATIFLGAGGMAVLRGQMAVGTFVTSLNAISTFGGLTGSIFQAVFDLMKGYASVTKISELFNTSTRREWLRDGRNQRNAKIKVFNAEALSDPEANRTVYNPIEEQIQLHNVHYKPNHVARQNKEGGIELDADADADVDERIEAFCLPNVSAIIEAGAVIALTGPGGCGKTTLMRILARHYNPSIEDEEPSTRKKITEQTKEELEKEKVGFVSYPDYWRVRLLDAMDPPYFFKGTMRDNLAYGNVHSHTDREFTELIEKLGVSQQICDNMADMVVETHGSNLSLTDATLCAIARCLLSSVDLLLISNLVDVLSEEFAENVMTVLKDMVKYRKMSYLRSENAMVGGFHKPKTVIISTKKKLVEDAADTKISMADLSHDGVFALAHQRF